MSNNPTTTAGRAILAAIVLGAVGATSPAWGQQACPEANSEALQWLDKMSRSLNQVSYHGVVTYQRGNEEMQVVQVAHSVSGGTSSERMTQLTGQGAEVVRKEHPLDCVHPGHKLLRLGEDFEAGYCEISRNYRFNVSDGQLVAGRKAVRVQIEPSDVYRYGYVMELDRATGLLLKTATIGRGGIVLEKFQFADLSYDEPASAGQDVDVSHHAMHPAPSQSGAVTTISHPWGVNWLPRGFTATDAQSPTSGRKTFTDGLAVFSVFMEELGREIRPGEGVVREGSTTSYTRGLRLSEQPVLITVVGEVPVNTARMVADSVKWTR